MDPNQTPTNPPVAPPAASPMPADTLVTATQPTVIQPAGTEPTLPQSPSSAPQPLYTPPTLSPSQPVMGGGGGLPPQNNKRALLMKWAPIAGVAALVLGVGGYIFGFYLPNQPDNVWQSGLKNSGKALSSLALDLNSKGQLEKLKKTELVVTGQIKGDNISATVNANTKLDSNKSVTSASTQAKGGGTDLKLNIDLLTEVPQGKIYPNVYFKVDGLKSLGESSLFSGFSAYDNKWITVSSDYLEKMYKSSGTDNTPSTKEQITSGDVAEAIKAVSDVSNDYLFSANPDKAVLENKEYKGKEVVDGVSTYHYIVGVNKDHAVAYCKALTLKVNSLSIAKKTMSEKELKDSTDNAEKDCKQSLNDEVKDGETFDAWVNTKYKLIHKVRFYEATDKKNYVDVGQLYKGGKNLSLFTSYHNEADKSDVKLVVDLNTKDITSKGTLTLSSQAEGNKYDGTFSLEVKPYSGDVKVDKPANATSIEELFGSFGADYSSDYQAQSLGAHTINLAPLDANDLKRQLSLGAIRVQLDAYKTKSGVYPTLAQLNDAKWRKTNLPNLDAANLKDPKGDTLTLASAATSTQYGYKTTGCTLKGCSTAVLEAFLSNGEKYTK